MPGRLWISKKLQAHAIRKLDGPVDDRLRRLIGAHFLVGTITYASILEISEIPGVFSSFAVQIIVDHEHFWFTVPAEAQTHGIPPMFTHYARV